MADLSARVAELEAQIARLLQRTASLPSRTAITGPPPDRIVRFELKQSLSAYTGMGSWADAYVLGNLGGGDAVRTTEVITVWNHPLDNFCGLGADNVPSGQEGYKGFARYWRDTGRWEIVSMEHAARTIDFELTAALSFGSHTGTGDVIGVYDGRDPDPNGYGVTLLNPATAGSAYRFGGASGTNGTAVHAPAAGLATYAIIQMDCP